MARVSIALTGAKEEGFSKMQIDSGASASEDFREIHEGLRVKLVPAPLGKRLVAYATDLGIMGAILYALMIPGAIIFGFLIGMLGSAAGSYNRIIGVLFAITLLLLILGGYHGYFIYYELRKGQTPGKRLFGLTVISADGARLSLGQCIMRDFFRYIDCALFFPGLISVLATSRHQRIGDLAAGTIVVHSSSEEAQAQTLYLNHNDYTYLLATLTPPPDFDLRYGESYLAAAYPHFITRHSQMTGAERDRWLRSIRSLIPGATVEVVAEETLLLFFAELCFQRVNQINRNKNK